MTVSARDTPLVPRIKGAAIRELVKWYAATHGTARLHAVAAGMPKELRDALDPDDDALGILANQWYEARLVHALLDGLVGIEPSDTQRTFLHEATRAAVRSSARGVYKFLIQQIATPALYARTIPRAWRLLHDTGDRVITLEGPGVARSLTTNWPGHHALLCLVTAETMAAVFELMGLADVRLDQVQCVSRGDARCEYVVRWRV